MTNEELAIKMQLDEADREFLEELQKSLQIELEKPVDEQDHEHIRDLIQTIAEICGTGEALTAEAEKEKKRLKDEISKATPAHRMIRVRWLIPIACAMILLISNVLSYTVFGMNVFSAAVRISDGSIVISFDNDNTGSKADDSHANYASEILEICKENGFTPLVPSYIPNGLKPTESWGEVTDLAAYKEVNFNFINKKKKLNICIFHILDAAADIDYGFPSQSYNLSEETICGNTVYVIKEGDSEFHFTFKADNIVYAIYCDGYDEIEIRKIIYSMFE